MRPAFLSRTLHKWFGLLIGAQLVLWAVSGFYMVVVDLDFIHGDPLVRNLRVPVALERLELGFAQIAQSHPEATQISLRALPTHTTPVYEVSTPTAKILIDSADGQALSPLPEETIRALARSYYAGKGALRSVSLLQGEPPLEIQTRKLPLWRADFDDWLETSLYIHPDTGALVTRRHRFWRWFDFLWMLHIMDYEQRTDVNNSLLRATTAASLIGVMSGLWLLYFSLRTHAPAQRARAPSFMLIVRKLHKWLGLIVGVQVLLWTVSGFVFAWLDHHQVSAEHSAREVEPKELNVADVAEPSTWLVRSEAAIHGIQLTSLLDEAVWRVESAEGVALHTLDGALITLDGRTVRELALRRYVGPGELKSISFAGDSTLEARGAGAVWRAEFADPSRTTMYFSAEDGRLFATRNAAWRWFDFFWMLHTMDYRGRDDFNNPLVIVVGTATLCLALSGFLLLFRSFRREDFHLPARRSCPDGLEALSRLRRFLAKNAKSWRSRAGCGLEAVGWR